MNERNLRIRMEVEGANPDAHQYGRVGVLIGITLLTNNEVSLTVDFGQYHGKKWGLRPSEVCAVGDSE